MAGMPRLLAAAARRPLAASLYRAVYSVFARPATSSPRVLDFNLPRSHGHGHGHGHGWETRVGVRAFSAGQGGGGSPGESSAAKDLTRESHLVKEQGRPKTKSTSRAKAKSTSPTTSPPASSSEGERHIQVEDPGLRSLASPASGIGKDTVSVPSVNTDASDGAGAESAIGEVSVPSVNIVNAGAVTGSIVNVNVGAVGGGTDAAADKAKEAGDGVKGTEEASPRKRRARKTRVKPAAADVEKNAAPRKGNTQDAKVSVPSVNKEDSDGIVNTGAASCVCKDDGGVNTGVGIGTGKVATASLDTNASNSSDNMGAAGGHEHGACKDAAFDTGMNAAAGIAKEAGHGDEKKKDPLPEMESDGSVTSEEKKAVTIEEKKASTGKGAGSEQKASTGNGSGDLAAMEKDKGPGSGSTDSEWSQQGTGPEGSRSSHPGGKSGNTNSAGAGSPPGEKGGEKKKKKAQITLAEYLRALEHKIERGLFETRAHLERKLSWVLSSIQSTLHKHRTLMEEHQIANLKSQSKQTILLFLGVFVQLLGLLAVCAYAGYNYAWGYVEKKIYELPYDDRAKALALQVFESGVKYAVATITFQSTRDELKSKLPVWLGGKKQEKKGEEEKKEETVTHSLWWRLWPPNWRRIKEEKKEIERKRKEEEEKKRKEEEEEEEKKKKKYSRWWWLRPSNWWTKNEEDDEKKEEKWEGEKKENDE